MEFCEIFDETTRSQKTSSQTHKLFWLLVFQVLIISKRLFKYITVAAFRIMLSVVKMPLKGEVGGHVLNSYGIYIADHGKIMELCF